MGPTTRLPGCRPLSLSQATPAFKSLAAGCGKQTTEAGCFILLLKVICALFCGVSFFFSFGLKVYEILVPPPMIKPTSLCFGRQNLNHWTPGESLKALFKAQPFRCPSLLETGFHLPFLSSTGLGRTYWNIRMCEAAVTSTAQNP